MKKCTIILMLYMAIVITGCHKNAAQTEKPEYLIAEDTLAQILVDIHKADGLLVSRIVEKKDITHVEMYHSVFSKYNIDEDVFNNTIRYYTVNDIETLNQVYDEVLAVLNEEQAKLTQKLQE